MSFQADFSTSNCEIVINEQIYRAKKIQENHPYHK